MRRSRIVTGVLQGALLAGAVTAARAQINTGELRLRVTDVAGAGLRASVSVDSDATEVHARILSDEAGNVDLRTLPYGEYRVQVEREGFAPSTVVFTVSSPLAPEHAVRLSVAATQTTVTVHALPLLDVSGSASVRHIGSQEIEDRVASLPGRSVQDLVNTQPGWLYEGNAVLHPRGSEYQTQIVIDGIPLTDNRSPSFGPEIEAEDVGSMSLYTAGFPAEYGRKLGGVVELNTKREDAPGLHGQVAFDGGSYDTAQGYAQGQYATRSNLVLASASGSRTAHYLNPVVPENYTNRGTTGDFALRAEHDLSAADRIALNVRHEFSRFDIPNEQLQQVAGQLQTGANVETIGTATYRHTISAKSLLSLAGMVRDNATDLDSNAASTPILAVERNSFREGYFKGTWTLDGHGQEFKAGVESDATSLHENFRYDITDSTQFDDGTPQSQAFAGSGVDLEQAVFADDTVRLGAWTVRAGLRWDHYQLLLHEQAFSPRIAVARSFPTAGLILHASFDRIFQTPSNANILISSSAAITSLNPEVLRLPVHPSRGNYYEGGAAEALGTRARITATVYRRDVRNYADDDQLLNTGVSYPISFDHAAIYGAEGALDVVHLGPFSGYASYSYMVGKVWEPVTGGLFLGDDVTQALASTTGHFPDSQDQRNTVRTRVQYQLTRHAWLATGLTVDSGLPFEFGGTPADALAQYGPAVVSRVNFDRGRVRPALGVSASLGTDLHRTDRLTMRFQVDGTNLTNRLNVIDFGGLFSGNAIAPGRSYHLRLTASF